MTPEQKKRIIKRFLEEASSPKPYVIADEVVDTLPKYLELGNALDALQISHDHLLDFVNVETNPLKWNTLTQVLNSGISLRVGAPSQIVRCELRAMQTEATSINDDLFIDTLPQPDYFNRVTGPDHVTQAATINPLIVAA